MHDLTYETHWHEPTGLTSKAGLGTFKKPPMPYDVFMEEQEIPIVRAVGVSRVQDLPLKPWKRMGGTRDVHPALRHRGPLGHVRGRGAGRRRAQCRAAPLREE